MATPWPTSLQSTLNEDSFSVNIGETTIRTDMDIGPAKVRRRTTRPIDSYSCSINIFQTDYLTMTQFYNTTLNGGVTPFEFVDPITGLLTVFRFLKAPSFSPLGSAGYFRVEMQWEKLS